MSVEFVAYIDESGDTGLQAIKPVDPSGASEWLVLACALVTAEYDRQLVGLVRDILSRFTSVQSPHLHFADLIPAKKRIACEILAEKPLAYFLVMSNKKNIRRYRNPNLDDGNKAWIYWWLTRLLLERVTKHCEERMPKERAGAGKLRITFSRRGRLKYSDFNRYLTKLYLQSRTGMLVLDQGDLAWPVIDFEEIFVLDHKDRAGLQIADVAAGAFFQAVERNRPAECDPQYAKLLKPRLARNRANDILGYGIKTMPDLWEMGLDLRQREIFEYCGFNKEGW